MRRHWLRCNCAYPRTGASATSRSASNRNRASQSGVSAKTTIPGVGVTSSDHQRRSSRGSASACAVTRHLEPHIAAHRGGERPHGAQGASASRYRSAPRRRGAWSRRPPPSPRRYQPRRRCARDRSGAPGCHPPPDDAALPPRSARCPDRQRAARRARWSGPARPRGSSPASAISPSVTTSTGRPLATAASSAPASVERPPARPGASSPNATVSPSRAASESARGTRPAGRGHRNRMIDENDRAGRRVARAKRRIEQQQQQGGDRRSPD